MRLAVIALVIGVGGVAHAGSGGMIPPFTLDGGMVADHAQGETRSQGEMLLGINAATMLPYKLPFDVGLGWVVVGDNSNQPGQQPPSSMPLTLDSSSSSSSSSPAPAAPMTRSGFYIDASGLLAQGDHWRTWFTPRGEIFGGGLYGAAVRVSAEVWTPAVGAGGRAAVFGTLALGVFAEVGVRQEPDAVTARFAASGLEVRVPFMIAD
jgi:hypothetical protein